ncbi:MAG TPA: N4-gp56 family major capsid protein [Candidatus Woesebacteria bacterium]|nr:N4-gp56 family major capsid protein [Candidatus Woesebacteria bacterium]
MSAETTTTLSGELMTLYEKVFLKRNQFEQIYEEGLQKRSRSMNEGKTIVFNRYTPLSAATTPLTEGSDPSEVSLTGAQVSATLSEYGTKVKISRFLSLTSVDENNKEKIAVVGQNMRETMDTLARNELDNLTAYLANAKAAVTDLAATDVISAANIRKVARNLEAAYARKYADGFYMWKVTPYVKADLIADSTWVNAKTYSGVKDLYRGEIGELYGFRFLLSANVKTTSSTATVYHTYAHGADAVGVYDLDGDQPKLYIIPHTQIDSANATGRFSLASWAGSYVAKTLVSTWGYVAKFGATA